MRGKINMYPPKGQGFACMYSTVRTQVAEGHSVSLLAVLVSWHRRMSEPSFLSFFLPPTVVQAEFMGDEMGFDAGRSWQVERIQ